MNSFKRNLLIGYSLSLLLLIASAVASYSSINTLLHSQELVDRTNTVIKKLEQVISIVKDAETGQRGYLLTGQPEFLEPYNGSLEKASRVVDEIKLLVVDDPRQLQSLNRLSNIIHTRLSMLEARIVEKRMGKEISIAALGAGKAHMDEARGIIQEMQRREESTLSERTSKMQRFAALTPTLVIIASLLSLIVTVVSFLRVNRDFENRTALQRELEAKDLETRQRLNLIKSIAQKISSGDYKTRVSDEGKDVLGNLAFALNKMGESLDYSFTNISEKEWMQTGIATLNERIIGEKNLRQLTYNVLDQVTRYLNAQVAAFYLVQPSGYLLLSSSIGLKESDVKTKLQPGESIAGEVARSKNIILLENLDDSAFVVNIAAGEIRPKSLIAVPVFYESRLKGVIEIATLGSFTEPQKEYLRNASVNIGMAIHSALDHQRLQELLAETQAQSEELQSQQTELENINSELEAQSEKLQASEEELKVQQEELQQSNQELEERSRLLEEKNELILERNLEIQRKAEQLELSTKYKSEFLANMSHELRTPLNSILLLSRLLSENHSANLTNDQVEYASVIQNSGKGLLTLIDEILDLSKIESGKMELEYSDVHMQEIQHELQAMFSQMAREKGLDFGINIDSTVPGVINIDKLRLEQIIRNLLSNALKFTKKGSVNLNVSLKDGALSFAVKDTGIGIPTDKQQTIFEAFQQADGSTRRQYGGTGLGLSISRELAKLLGGKITVTSKEGKGSEFTLLIPLVPGYRLELEPEAGESLQPEYEEPVRKLAEASDFLYITDKIPASIEDDREQVTQGDKTILIIEDDTSFARSLLDYTRQKGYKGIVAVRGDEGVAFAQRYLPSGILLDVQLPIKSGWQVMEELKSNPHTRPIPVHMMSSHEVKTRSLSKGAVDFINKPVAFEKLGEVFQRIEHALTHHPKKVLIVEENPKHAQALAYFLETYKVKAEIRNSIGEGIIALNDQDADCVILDMGIPAQRSYDILDEVKQSPGLENLPIIVFTGKNLSHVEEMKIRQYADSIVVKTANSYQRILDEVSLFLHLVEENKSGTKSTRYKKLGELSEVLKGKIVLVADDDVRNIFSLTKSLENYGMKVVSAMDGKEALNQLNEQPHIDLVLMDMMMPEMDGYESTRKIRQIRKYQKVPIIAVTAKAMTGDREKCIAAGASDYITKPVDIDQLISLLRVWLYE